MMNLPGGVLLPGFFLSYVLILKKVFYLLKL